MTTLTIPSDGLTIDHGSSIRDNAIQIIRLDLAQNLTREILRTTKSNGNTTLRLGNKPAICIDKKVIPLNHGPEKFTFELFKGDLDGSKPFFFTGTSTNVLEVHQTDKNAAAGKLAVPRNNLVATQSGRPSAGLLGTAFVNDGPKHSPMLGSRLLSSSKPSASFSSLLSPRIPPTSHPLATSAGKKDKILMEAVKIPLIHLLAVQPSTSKELADKLRMKQKICDAALEKVAQDSKDKDGKVKKQLRDKVFRDLDVWKFPYATAADRFKAIDHAVSAFDRMRIGTENPLWNMLNAPQDRDKKICLSKLNFDRILPGTLTPKISERSGEGSTAGKSMSSSNSGSNGKSSNTSNEISTAKTTPLVKPKRPITAAAVRKLTAVKDTPKMPVKSLKANTEKKEAKFKSAARVVDSDEETETIRVLPPATKTAEPPAKRQKLEPAKVVSVTKTAPSSIPQPQPPPHANGASHGTKSDAEKSSTRQAPLSKPTKSHPGLGRTQSQTSPRSRHAYSPQNPSPLASSPNKKSDERSKINQVTDQFSAATIPIASTTDPKDVEPSKRQTVSSHVPEKRPEHASKTVTKRKAETEDVSVPVKRQQIEQGKPNGVSTTQKLESNVKATKTHTPNSETSSNSEKNPPTKQQMIEIASKFKTDWTKYEALHKKLEQLDPEERGEKELGKLERMRSSLDFRKKQIWKDWSVVLETELK